MIDRRRVLALFVLGLVVAGPIAIAEFVPSAEGSATGATASTQSSYVSITDVTVTPDDPAPGETITLRSTVRNLEGSGAALDITAVAITRSDTRGINELTRIEDLGTLSPGSSLTVPQTVSFEEPGTKRLRVEVYGIDENDQSVQVQYPVVVRVTDEHPQFEIEINETVASTTGQGRITVANGLTSDARNVRISATSDELDVTGGTTVLPTLASGDTATSSFSYEADQPGTYFVDAELSYTIDGSQTRSVRETVPVEVEPFRENVVLEATRAEAGSSTVAVDVFNRGNVPIENVTISGTSPNATLPQRFLGEVPAQSAESLAVNTSLDTEQATIRMRAQYDVGSSSGVVTDGVTVESTPGQIDLTGVDVRREAGRLQVTGSASNLGLTTANSVVVRVQDTDQVTPAAPTREYFVGSVPESDFVSFEVYARTEGNVSTIPLEVSYLVDGERETRTVEVPYRAVEGPDQPVQQSPDRGLLVPAAVGGAVVVGISVAIFLGWRRSRGGA